MGYVVIIEGENKMYEVVRKYLDGIPVWHVVHKDHVKEYVSDTYFGHKNEIVKGMSLDYREMEKLANELNSI